MTIANELERQRQANIKRNQSEINKLGITEIIKEKKIEKPKPIKKVPKIIDQEPIRKSRRLTGREPEIKLESEYIDMSSFIYEYNGIIKKDLANDISFKDTIPKEAITTSRKFLNKIQSEIKIKSKDTKSNTSKLNVDKTKKFLAKMKCLFEGPIKLTSSQVNSIQVHPNKERIITFAGTKKGELIIWDANPNPLIKEENNILSLDIHRETISCIQVDPNDNSKLFTSGWDGYLKLIDLNKERVQSIFTTNETIHDEVKLLFSTNSLDTYDSYFKSFSGVSTFSARKDAIWAAGNDGLVFQFDHREKRSALNAYKMHYKKINTIDFKHNDPNVFITSSLDRNVRIWDTRNLKRPNSDDIVCDFVQELSHKNSINSAYFSPQSDMLLLTCYDDYLYIYSDKEAKWNITKKIKHNNQTGK